MSEMPSPELTPLPPLLTETGHVEYAEILDLSEVTGDTLMKNTPVIPRDAADWPAGETWYDTMIEPPVKESVKKLNDRGLLTFTSSANNTNVGPLDQNSAHIGIKIDDSEASRQLLNKVAELQREVAESGFKPNYFVFSLENNIY